MEYGGHICLDSVCEDVNQKWRFLGRHIYLYVSVPEARGVIWDRDQPVDMMANGSDPDFLPHLGAGESQTALGRVLESGDDVALSRHVQIKGGNGIVEVNTWLRIAIRLPDCDRCELIVYEMSGESGHMPSQSTMQNPWCRILSS